MNSIIRNDSILYNVVIEAAKLPEVWLIKTDENTHGEGAIVQIVLFRGRFGDFGPMPLPSRGSYQQAVVALVRT